MSNQEPHTSYKPAPVRELSPARRSAARADVWRMIAEMGLAHASPGEVASKVRKRTFREHDVYSTLQHIYNGSPYAALKDIYPDLRPWQMAHVPMSYWMDDEGREHAREATRWLIGQLDLGDASPQDIAQQVDTYVFDRYALRGMLQRVYRGSPYEALRDVLPGLMAWERNDVPRDYWLGEEGHKRAREATLSMLEKEGLKHMPVEDIARRVTQDTFVKHRLLGMLGSVYASSPYEAIRDIFPELHPWQMSKVPHRYWQGNEGHEHARDAMRWLLAKLKLDERSSREELVAALPRSEFEKNGLSGMLQTVYGARIYVAIDDLLENTKPES
ncbi:MAG: hypothetical protein ABI670_01120 [Chloroflexota bacterium]